MKIAKLTAVALFMVLALPPHLAAQDKQYPRHRHKHHHYQLIDLGSFGGTISLFSNPGDKVINNRGTATWVADTSIPDPYSPNCFFLVCFVAHAFVWRDGVTTDLGTLPGGLSSFPYEVNNRGLIVGQSQNGSIDPLTSAPEVRGVLWRKGQIIDLSTLGGNASNASTINDRGQVVGAATNATLDPFANAPQGACQVLPTTLSCSGSTFAFNSLYSPSTTETRAFAWQDGIMRDIGTLGGPDSTAAFNNDHGEVAGWSYTSFVANPSTGVPTVDPFLWSPETDTMTDLGSLGGTFGAPFFLNNRGQVVGISNLPGDTIAHPFLWSRSEGMKDLGTLGGTFGFPTWVNDAGEVVGTATLAGDQVGHAFLWRHGVMTDLGTVGTDSGSEAFSINSQGQVVGSSADVHGFLWEHGGPIADLNALLLPGSGLTVNTAAFITDLGEIAGTGIVSNGDQHAVLLIPCDEHHPGVEGCDYSMVDAATAARVSPAPAIQHPAALTPRGRMHRGMLNRFRFPGSPPTPSSGTAPAPDAQQAPPADDVTDYLEADHRLDPEPAGRHAGYCIANSSGLTGYCSAYNFYSCLAKPSPACPSGQKAKKPGYFRCSNTRQAFVDLGRGCGF